MASTALSPDGIPVRYEVHDSGAESSVEDFITPFREDFTTTTRDFVRRMFVSSSDTDLVEWVVADMSAAPVEVALGSMKHAVTNEGAAVAALRDIAAPLVAINPDYRPTDVDALERHGVKTVLMSGVGHFAMLEDPTRSTACSARPSRSSRNRAAAPPLTRERTLTAWIMRISGGSSRR